MIKIVNRKYFSEWANGETFSDNLTDFGTHLKGSAGEKLKFVTTVRAACIATCDISNQWEAQNGNIIKRNSGSWIVDGFAVGQGVSFVDYYTGIPGGSAASVKYTATISAISDLEVTLTSISVPTNFTVGPLTDNALICLDPLPALFYDSALVENSAADSFTSPYTNDKQSFYFGSIDTGTPTVHTMVVAGGLSASKTWLSGPATVKFLQSTDDRSLGVDYIHEYEITQEFVINPVFLEGYLDALNNGTQPDDFAAGKSLKHISQYEFRYALSNPNTSIKVLDNQLIGSVGWFGENYNGFNNNYTVSNVVFYDEDLVITEKLRLNNITTVTGSLTGTGFTNTSKAGIYFFWGAPASIYQSVLDGFEDAFLWDSIIATMAGGTAEVTGSGRIKRFKLTYFSATHIDFEADIEFSDAEIALINPALLTSVADKYFIGVQIGDTGDTDTSDKLILQVDWNTFDINNDVAGLARFFNQRFYDHGMVETSAGHTDYKGWKQDGFLYASSLFLKKSLNAELNALQARLIAYNLNTGASFDLQKFVFDLSQQVVVNGVATYQKLDLDTTRGFKLATDDQFNQVYLTFSDPVSGEQEVALKLGVKFDWQSWIRLNGADTIFYDSTLDSKGMGLDASRYSLNNDYIIRFVIDADVDNGDVITRYSDMSPSLDIYGWGLEDDDPAEWSGLVETFDMDGNNTSGAILKNADTKLKITWTPQGGSTAGFDDTWAVHRIEAAFARGYNNIDEFSSIWDSRTGNLLKVTPGQTFLKITDFGTYVETECVIDYTKLGSGDYNLSGRLSRTPSYPRYNIARDIKLFGENEFLMFNCPDNGVAVSNSLRIATVANGTYEIVSEIAIALSASYSYINWRMRVSSVVTNGRYNFYAVIYDGLETTLFEFRYNGVIYVQTEIWQGSIAGGGPCAIFIDPALEPNGRPYIWFGNLAANIGATNDHGFKHAYYDGAAWQVTNWVGYDNTSPTNDMCRYAVDGMILGNDLYVMNYDQPPQSTQYNEGKIAIYTQTAGSTTDPADRTNFANWALSYNIYRNSGDTENQDGLGDNADLAFGNGFELLGMDENDVPMFLIVHDASLGGRHFSRIRANVAIPASDADWTIETPMIATNALYGNPQAITGYADTNIQSSPLQRKRECHLLVLGTDDFITGTSTKGYWVRHKINSWTGDSMNTWNIYSPNDPNYDFTTGNILK